MGLLQENATIKSEKGAQAYQAPLLYAAGTAVQLIQGPIVNGSYKDTCNNWYSAWSKSNNCG